MFRQSIEVAPPILRHRVLEDAARWVDATDPQSIAERRYGAGFLVPYLFRHANDSSPWTQAIADSNASPNLLASVATGAVGLDGVESARAFLLNANMPADLKSEIASNIILQSRSTRPDTALARLLTAPDVARLRERVRSRTAADGEASLPINAIATLAHLGDEPTLDAIRSISKQLTPSSNIERALAWHRTMIEIQQQPNGVVVYLHEVVPIDPQHVNQAVWALNRAVELGAAKEVVADACLAAFARSRSPVDRMAAAILAREALELGVLTEEQLPRAIAANINKRQRTH